ncbi:hypothetical protein DPX16_7088 [Anabarilius grahami]|uniref:Uncharacterized protein n=1 Tax=Anabarilius grahami TaxID=495550 RepID=A0A3N0XJ84_ANAGA|nr:hypothetical protein DPX16_7088 [Anabarilius grahami]
MHFGERPRDPVSRNLIPKNSNPIGRRQSYGATRKYKGAPTEAVRMHRLFGTTQAAAGEDAILDDDDGVSQTSSDPGTSVLLAASPQEQVMAVEEEASGVASFSRPPCPAYAELLEVMERAAGRLQLPWQREKEETARGRLDERFLSGHNPVTPVSLPFLPDLHVEIEKAWKNPFSARIHTYQRSNFADVEGLRQHGHPGGPGPSRAEAQKQVQRSSVAARASPPPRSKSQKRRDTRNRRPDLREVIDNRRQNKPRSLDGWAHDEFLSDGPPSGLIVKGLVWQWNLDYPPTSVRRECRGSNCHGKGLPLGFSLWAGLCFPEGSGFSAQPP